MTVVVVAAGGDASLAFIEIGAVALALSVLARLAGLAVGEGGIAPLDVSGGERRLDLRDT